MVETMSVPKQADPGRAEGRSGIRFKRLLQAETRRIDSRAAELARTNVDGKASRETTAVRVLVADGAEQAVAVEAADALFERIVGAVAVVDLAIAEDRLAESRCARNGDSRAA